MIKFIKNLFICKYHLISIIKFLYKIDFHMDQIKINQGKYLSSINKNFMKSNNIQDYEFKIFSQNGEDGILQFLISSIEIKNKTFIEFGVEDFSESNCRFLLLNNNWSGYVIDGSKKNIDKIKNSYYYPFFDIRCEYSFIRRANINKLLKKSNFSYDLGILSIDLDGNDYFILNEIKGYRPRILICEFNNIFGLHPVSVVYDDNFIRTKKHYSGVYQGASLYAFVLLAEKLGYSLVTINSAGMNAFFVRNDLLNKKIKKINYKEYFAEYKIRAGFDNNNYLKLYSFDEKQKLIKDMNVYNVKTKKISKFSTYL